jgi:hypothetical protein
MRHAEPSRLRPDRARDPKRRRAPVDAAGTESSALALSGLAVAEPLAEPAFAVTDSAAAGPAPARAAAPVVAALRRRAAGHTGPAPTTSIRRTRATADQAQKGVPAVTDAKLKNYVKDLYKGVRVNPRIGDGSCADAIRHELANKGAQVGGRGHIQKGEEYSRGLTNWLAKNPTASEADRAAAQTIIDDLASALGGDK